MRTSSAGISDVGLQRDHNEDCFAVLEEHGLYLVADGMGGHRAGDVASKLAAEAIAEFFERTAHEELTWPYQFDSQLTDEENRLLTAIRLANRQIYEHSVRSRDLRGMGTTVVGAVFSDDRTRVYVGHVGDSRAYRVRDGKIEQLTRDHSLVNDYLAAMPEMTDEQRSELPRNVITRALGMQDNVEIDVSGFDVMPGDAYLLCSDGLSGMISDGDMLDVVVKAGDAVDACQRLVTMANEHGGEDNITAVVIRTESEKPGELSVAYAKTMPFAAQPMSGQTLNSPSKARVDAMAKTPPAGVSVADALRTTPAAEGASAVGAKPASEAEDVDEGERPTELPAIPGKVP